MTGKMQSLTARNAFGGALILGGIAMLWLAFASPDHERDLPAMPPLVLPKPASAPTIGHAAPAIPDAHRKAGECGGASEGIAIPARPATPPQSWIGDDDYPTMALIAGHSGVTTTDLVIDDHGMVIGCGVSASSRHYSLDTKACLLFRQRARFVPAQDKNGCPVASVWHQRVRWVLAS